VPKSTTLDDLERPISTLEPTTKIWMKIGPYCRRQICRPMTLVSGGIRLMRIFAEVPWGGGVKLQWGCRKRQFSAILMAIFSDTLEMRPVLLYGDMQSVIGFSVIPKCMTLNDLDWLFCVKFCFCWLRPCDYGNNCVKTNKDRHTLSAVQYLWQGLLVSGNIRFVRIFGQVL